MDPMFVGINWNQWNCEEIFQEIDALKYALTKLERWKNWKGEKCNMKISLSGKQIKEFQLSKIIRLKCLTNYDFSFSWWVALYELLN